MLNTIAIDGRFSADPQLRSTNNGTKVCTFTLAVGRDKGTEADWIDCVAWGDAAETICKYLSKGRRVIVEGRLQTHTFEKDGKRNKACEVIVQRFHFADSKKAEETPVDDNGELPF